MGEVDLHPQGHAMKRREAGHHRLRPRRLVGEQVQVPGSRQVADMVAFVGREIFRRPALGDVAAGPMEARQIDPLVDVLAVVPLVEVALVAGLHFGIDDQHSLAVQRHGFVPL